MNHPQFKDRWEAIAYYRSALRKEDDKLQETIQASLKRMEELRKNLEWNQQELKKELEAERKLTSFSRAGGISPSALGLNSTDNQTEELEE